MGGNVPPGSWQGPALTPEEPSPFLKILQLRSWNIRLEPLEETNNWTPLLELGGDEGGEDRTGNRAGRLCLGAQGAEDGAILALAGQGAGCPPPSSFHSPRQSPERHFLWFLGPLIRLRPSCSHKGPRRVPSAPRASRGWALSSFSLTLHTAKILSCG